MHVVVIGAGIVGACTAIELLRDGHAVTILDGGAPGGPQAASYGNAAWLSPASVVPMSMPGLWRKVPGFLLDPEGALTIRLARLPHLAPWLIRFLFAGATPRRAERIAGLLAPLLADTVARHQQLAAEAGAARLIRAEGLLYVYPDRSAFLADAPAWALRRSAGLGWRELDAAALRAAEPDLSARYGFAVMVEGGGHCTDPGRYVAALVAHAQALGATLRRAAATGFATGGGRLRAVSTAEGQIACDKAVIAAGIGSKRLASAAGDRVSLESERGYHVVVAAPEAGPRRPLMPSDGRMGNTPVDGGLRASGQVELASVEAPPDWRRADILLRQLLETYPGLPRDLPAERVSRWMGHRPSTPDGLPVIGRARLTPDVVHAFGHGHIGLASGPFTGRLAADLVSGAQPALDPAPFDAARFRLRRRPRA